MCSHGQQLLGSHGYDRLFDEHFDVKTEFLHDALHNGATKGEAGVGRCCRFPEYKSDPEAWGIKVRLIWRLWEYVAEDLQAYAYAHNVDENRRHICLAEPCAWDHMGDEPLKLHECNGKRFPLKPSMYLLVHRYVKPLTQTIPQHVGAGFALHLNAAKVVTVKGLKSEDWCFPSIFISHAWSEDFCDFATTLHRTLDPDCVVWVCSLAIWQHGNIADALSDVESCTFAKAMKRANRVVGVTDSSADAFSRCWVVFEADLARKWGKPYDISLPDNSDVRTWNKVGTMLEALDVSCCGASRAEDKVAILNYARQGTNGIDGLNATVRRIAGEAMRRAGLLAAVANGSIHALAENNVADDELLKWRSIRGRTVTHIAAQHSQIGVIVEVSRRLGDEHINAPDIDGHTPLNVAIQHGALAAVEALICFRADVHYNDTNKLTPLHWAASNGHNKICGRLLSARCEIEARGRFEGRAGMTPLLVAANAGQADVIRALVRWRADVEVRDTSGFSAMHLAAIRGSADAVVALIQMNANVDGRDNSQQRTPLMFACSFGRLSVVAVLLGSKARVDAQSGGKNAAKDVFHYCEKSRSAEEYPIMKRFLRGSQHSEDLIRRAVALLPAQDPDVTLRLERLNDVFAKFANKSGTLDEDHLVRTLELIDADGLSSDKVRAVLAAMRGSGQTSGLVDCRQFLEWIFTDRFEVGEASPARAESRPVWPSLDMGFHSKLGSGELDNFVGHSSGHLSDTQTWSEQTFSRCSPQLTWHEQERMPLP